MPKQTTATRFLRISEVLDRVGVSRPLIYRWVAAGEFPQANRYRCEFSLLVGVRRHQVDGPAHLGAMTHFNTNRTLLRQGNHRCFAFFVSYQYKNRCPVSRNTWGESSVTPERGISTPQGQTLAGYFCA